MTKEEFWLLMQIEAPNLFAALQDHEEEFDETLQEVIQGGPPC